MNLTEFHKEIKGYTQDRQPGIQKDMNPQPITEMEGYKSGGKLQGKNCIGYWEIRDWSLCCGIICQRRGRCGDWLFR